MTSSLRFESPSTWEDASQLLTFAPRRPTETLGRALEGLRVFVRDHKMRDVSKGNRSLEAHYGTFSLSQQRLSGEEAARRALDVRYGQTPVEGRILGRPARLYELGPEVPPDDVDGRMPSVVVWHDGEMFFLLASGELSTRELTRVAMSIHASQ